MADEVVFKPLYTPPTKISGVVFPNSLFIQKIFPSAKFKGADGVRTSGGGTTDFYTIPANKIFLLIGGGISYGNDGAAGAAGANGELHVVYEGQTQILCVGYLSNTGYEGGSLSMPINQPVAFYAGSVFEVENSTHMDMISATILGFEIDAFEWDRFITP